MLTTTCCSKSTLFLFLNSNNINQNDSIEFLLIQRKDSISYVEFIRGKYSLQNYQYLKNISSTGCTFVASHTGDNTQLGTQNINLIASFCNSSLKIRDLINGNDKFFKNDHARCYVELLNTKYNHLDLLTSDYNEVEEIENFEEMEKIRVTTPFILRNMDH